MKTLWTWLILVIPLCANALGVKNIEVFSALNQPLSAKIGLVSAGSLDIQDIKVRLASPKIFNEAEIARPYFLTRLKFEPRIDTDGNRFIQITSRDIVREPYLDFLLEVSWRGGSFIKEFAVLLDPVFIQQASTTPKTDNPKPTAGKPSPAKKQLYGPVRKSETLWVIAQKTRPSTSIPIKQMIMAIHQENPGAFVHGNINLLKQGTTLSIPDHQSITSLASGTVARLFSEQDQKWKDGPPKNIKPKTSMPQSMDVAPEIIQEKSSKLEINPDKSAQMSTTDADKMESKEPPLTKTTHIPDITSDDKAELQVIATPESQLTEVTKNESNKAYPKGEIEQLGKSIADTADDVTALESINQDLIRLRSALESKIALVQEELSKTNQAIAIVSGKLEVSDVAAEETIPAETKTPTDTTSPIPFEEDVIKSEATNNIQKADPNLETTAKPLEKPATNIATVIDKSEPEEASGINIATDLAKSERINRLETEIEALKAQSHTLKTQKYLIIILALACLVAFGLLIYTNRKDYPAAKKALQNPVFSQPEQINQLDSSVGPQKSERKQVNPNKHLEMPFDEPDTRPDEEISFAGHQSSLSNHDSVQSTLESQAATPDELPTPNTILFETSKTEVDQSIDSIITTVDVYLAYRRLTEAESILHNAIEKHPESSELKAKLLEIYAFKKDAKLFAQNLVKYEEELSVQAPNLWEEILIDGMQLIPDHPFIEAYTKKIQAGNQDTKDVAAGSYSLVDELVIVDVDMPDDDLFSIDQDDLDPFDIDLDLDKLKKS